MAKRKRGDLAYTNHYAPLNVGRQNNNQTDNRMVYLERMYRRVLGELAMNRFEWKGTEETGISKRYMELMLYQFGLTVVFRDDNIFSKDGVMTKAGTGKVYALRGGASGTLNLVGDPTHFTLTGTNFTGMRLPANKCVPIWANYFRQPDLDIVDIYAYKLAEIDRTIEINSRNARRNKVLTYNENSSLTAKNINDMIDRGEATIPVNFSLGDMVTALDLGVDPKSVETLSILRGRLWGEAMGLLGINNSNQDKKERLVEAEVSANDDQIATQRRVNLNARQEGARLANEMFGLNLSVDYYTEVNGEYEPIVEGK